MSLRVIEPRRDELEARRRRLLDKLYTTREALGRSAEAGVLTVKELWIWEDIRSIEFLLGEERHHEGQDR